MTAPPSPHSTPTSGSLAAGASPAAIRAGLFNEDRRAFDAAYGAALDEARHAYELAPLYEVLEEWRRRAILQSDPDAFRRSVRRAAEFFTGAPVPDGEPFAVTRARAGMQRRAPEMYRVETVGDDIDASVEALPAEFSGAFAELRAALEVSPWSVGRPYVSSNPRGSRTASFGPEGRGMVLYVVQEYERAVRIWQVTVFPDLEGPS